MTQRYIDLVNECLNEVKELFPWDVEEMADATGSRPLFLDVREPYEYEAMHIKGSINVPRGILESACDYGYEETVPDLAAARRRDIIIVCRSGYRSVLAAYNMQQMGYQKVYSLKTGLRGWKDYELPLVRQGESPVEPDEADAYFMARVSPEQLGPP
jgi:rhodanese-related sulfurtransferase